MILRTKQPCRARMVLAAVIGLTAVFAANVSFGQTAADAKPTPKSAAHTTPQEEQLQRLLQKFPQADADHDGVLTRTEANAFAAEFQARKKHKQQRRAKEEVERPQPTRADVKYGPHERNVFDLWLPEGAAPDKPVPVLIYFHGGGFVAGDKRKFDPTPYLRQGCAVVAANYRFVDGKNILAPLPMRDGARVVQFLRYHAKEYGIRPDRIALSGGSAGAVISLWVAFKDDMADPHSADPVARESTRVTCVLAMAAPTNLDPAWIRKSLGGPHELHSSLPLFYGVQDDDFSKPAKQTLIHEASPIEHATADDPPVFLLYAGELDNLPLPVDVSQGILIHHPYFGKTLKEKLDALGVECQFQYGQQRPSRGAAAAFLAKHLK